MNKLIHAAIVSVFLILLTACTTASHVDTLSFVPAAMNDPVYDAGYYSNQPNWGYGYWSGKDNFYGDAVYYNGY